MKKISGALLEVNLGSIEYNYKYITDAVGGRTKVAAVVKSDAYGLGLVPVASTLLGAGCDLLFVANLDEALRLRSAGVDAGIAVFDDDVANAHEIYRMAGLVAVVNTRNDLEGVQQATGPIPYFLNVETGFCRFGLNINDVRELKSAGVFDFAPPDLLLSHLACSDDATDPLNAKQRDRFVAASELLPRTQRSLIASAGVWLDPSYHFDVARIGSAIYGLNNARIQPNPLKQVVRLLAPLVEVRDVPPHETIGYGATFRTRRTTCMGIVGIGYKHGLPWSCANRVSVRIATFLAPVIGRISMEYTTVDLTDVPIAFREPGALVDFLYDDFGIDELASAAGVTGQEILIRLGGSCPRTYSRNARDETVLSSMLGYHSCTRSSASRSI